MRRINRFLKLPAKTRNIITILAILLVVLINAFDKPEKNSDKAPPPDMLSGLVSATLIDVHDGDSLTASVNGHKIKLRLYGIDAPELKQPFGLESRDYLRKFLSGKELIIQGQNYDQYKRLVAIVNIDATSCVNEKMLRDGQAWYYKNYCKKEAVCPYWKSVEQQAKRKRVGLWQDKNPVPPWQWRKKH